MLGADDLQPRFAFRLERPLGEELQRLVVGHARAVHLVVEDGVGHGAQIELELGQAQGEVAVAVALVEHHLLGIDRPAFDEHARLQHPADQRRIAVGVFELHVMARDRPRGW